MASWFPGFSVENNVFHALKNVPPDQVEPPADVEFYFSPCDALRSDASPRDRTQKNQKVQIITFLVLLSFVLVTWWRHIVFVVV